MDWLRLTVLIWLWISVIVAIGLVGQKIDSTHHEAWVAVVRTIIALIITALIILF